MNRRQKIDAALAQYDRHMIEATGYTHDEYAYARATTATDLRHVKLYGELVDESGAAEFLEECDRKDRKSAAGRKPQMSFRTTLVLLLMHIDSGDARYRTMAKTLFARTNSQTRAYLNLPAIMNTEQQWYMRIHRSMNRILDLLEPWEVSKKHHITAAEFVAAKATYSQEKRDRAEDLVNMLLHATVRRIPADILARYKGNVAIDATPIKLVGRPNFKWGAEGDDRKNLDAMSTRYTRAGNHEGQGHEADEPAWEMETVVTIPNQPGDNLSFPVITTGVSFQHPGRNKYGPLRAVKQHCKVFGRDRRYRLVGDQEYNWAEAERFQNEIRKLGFRGIWNFGSKGKGRSGIHGTFEDAIAADGRLFLKWTPRDLLTATPRYENGEMTQAEYIQTIEAREKYALSDHGRADEDGYQRWTYPALTRGMRFFDPVTDKPLARTPKLAKKSLIIGPNSAENLKIIKHLSAVQYYTTEWHAWYGLRNRVEENNDWFKSDEATDIGNPKKRRPRGYAYNFLFAGAAAAVSNMRRIVSHLEAEALEVVDKPTIRARRRVDIDGNPLEHAIAA